jgi:hypothetical protein
MYEVIHSEAIVVQYVNTRYQLADIFTKCFKDSGTWSHLLRLSQIISGTFPQKAVPMIEDSNDVVKTTVVPSKSSSRRQRTKRRISMSKLAMPIFASGIPNATGLSFIARESKHTAEVSINSVDGNYDDRINSDGDPKSKWDLSIWGGHPGLTCVTTNRLVEHTGVGWKPPASNRHNPSLTAHAVGGRPGEFDSSCPTGPTGVDYKRCEVLG